MRGSLETIVGAMFAGKTSELLKRILWAKHQNKKIVVIKPSLDNRYSESKIITHNDLSHECFAMQNWNDVNKEYNFKKENFDVVFLDEIQFLDTSETLKNIELILNQGIDVICAGLDQDSRGKPWETSAMLRRPSRFPEEWWPDRWRRSASCPPCSWSSCSRRRKAAAPSPRAA